MASILIVEDEVAIRWTLERVLKKKGHTVRCAANGKQGVELYLEQHTDIVITDVVMPVMDGLEVIREILRHEPEAKIITMSGSGSSTSSYDYLAIAKKFGAVRTIRKPFGANVLRALVDEVLTLSSIPAE